MRAHITSYFSLCSSPDNKKKLPELVFNFQYYYYALEKTLILSVLRFFWVLETKTAFIVTFSRAEKAGMDVTVICPKLLYIIVKIVKNDTIE